MANYDEMLAKTYKEHGKEIGEIMFDFAQGNTTMEEANEKLREIDPRLQLDREKNIIHEGIERAHYAYVYINGREKIGVVGDGAGVKLNQNIGPINTWAEYMGDWYKVVDGEKLVYDPELDREKKSEK